MVYRHTARSMDRRALAQQVVNTRRLPSSGGGAPPPPTPTRDPEIQDVSAGRQYPVLKHGDMDIAILKKYTGAL